MLRGAWPAAGRGSRGARLEGESLRRRRPRHRARALDPRSPRRERRAGGDAPLPGIRRRADREGRRRRRGADARPPRHRVAGRHAARASVPGRGRPRLRPRRVRHEGRHRGRHRRAGPSSAQRGLGGRHAVARSRRGGRHRGVAGSDASRSREAERVLVLEPSLDGAAKIARKGNGVVRAAFSGARGARGARAGARRLGAGGAGAVRALPRNAGRRFPRDDRRADRGPERRPRPTSSRRPGRSRVDARVWSKERRTA